MADQTCIRCAAHAAAVPQEEVLRWIAEGKPLDEPCYTPHPIDAAQAYAVEALVSALKIYVDAFGIRNAAARMQVVVERLNKSNRLEALTRQTLEAEAMRAEHARQASLRPRKRYGGRR